MHTIIRYTFIAGAFILMVSCSDINQKMDEKLDVLSRTVEDLDSLVNTELDKVQQLDTLINRELEKVEKLDSMINQTRSRIDTLGILN